MQLVFVCLFIAINRWPLAKADISQTWLLGRKHAHVGGFLFFSSKALPVCALLYLLLKPYLSAAIRRGDDYIASQAIKDCAISRGHSVNNL